MQRDYNAYGGRAWQIKDENERIWIFHTLANELKRYSKKRICAVPKWHAAWVSNLAPSQIS